MYFDQLSRTCNVWTHSGMFHADDVFAVAMLKIVMDDIGGKVLVDRSRTRPDINDIHYQLDVGGQYDPEKGYFDHHQKDGVPIRDNGIKYASAGMIIDHLGTFLIHVVYSNIFIVHESHALRYDPEQVLEIFKERIETIDAIDNGQMDFVGNSRVISINEIIKSFYPAYNNPTKQEEMTAFSNAVNFAKTFIINSITDVIYRIAYQDEVVNAIKAANNINSSIMILSTGCPFLSVIKDNQQLCENIKVIVFPGTTDGKDVWYIRTLPGNTDNAFIGKCHAPVNWRGASISELKELIGINTPTFVHPSGFLGGTVEYNDALKMARKWIDQA